MESLLEVTGVFGSSLSSSSDHGKRAISKQHSTIYSPFPIGASSDQRSEGGLKECLSPSGYVSLNSAESLASTPNFVNDSNSFSIDLELEEISWQMARLSLDGTQTCLLSANTPQSLSPSSRCLSVPYSGHPSSHGPGERELDSSIGSNFASLDIAFAEAESLDRISIASSDGEPVPAAAGGLFSTRTRCSICMDVSGVEQLACGHCMCRSCLSTLFLTALSDRSLLPVRCCQQPLREELATAVLPHEALLTLAQRTRQAQARDFMYCPLPSCSSFIDLDHLSAAGPGFLRRLECEVCLTAICAACRTAWHDLTSCDANRAALAAEALALEALAREEGWMRCGRCAVFVSRAHGCNHMTCACGHHFCYACGMLWKTCACTLWSAEERRFAEQARIRAALAEEREAQRRLLSAAEAQAVRERVRGVFAWEEERGECEHGDREHADGDFGACARCDWRCNLYGYRCGMCRLVFCRTCHFHRM